MTEHLHTVGWGGAGAGMENLALRSKDTGIRLASWCLRTRTKALLGRKVCDTVCIKKKIIA